MTRVLIADDDVVTCRALRLLLEEAGYAVSEAEDGLRAVEVLRDSPEPMVVLLDLMLPGLSGVGVLQAAGHDRDLATRHVFILITAAGAAATAPYRPLFALLGVPVVEKPFNLETVEAAVAEAERTLAARTAGSLVQPNGAPAAAADTPNRTTNT